MNTEKRIVSGVLVGFIGFTLGFVQSILLVPILLTLWGTEKYGIWLVLNAGYIILQTIDSGQQAYIGNEFNIKFYSNKMELRNVLASSLRFAFLIGIFQLILVLFLYITNTTHIFLGLNPLTISEEYLNVCLLLLIIAWITSGTYTSILSKLMISYGYYSKTVWWSIYNKIGSFLVLVIIAANNGSILDATIGISLFTIFLNYLFLFKIKSLLPDVYPWWNFGDWKTGWLNLRRSSLISLGGILQQFSNNGLILLITNLFGAILVPLFSTMRTLTNSAISITNILIQPLQPEIVKFHVQNELKKIIEIFNINWLINGIIINIGILIVLPFINQIYQIWTKNKLEFDLPLFLLLALTASFFNFGSVLVYYVHSLNRINFQLIIIIVKLFLIFSVSILLSKLFGILSVGIGLLTAELIAYVILPFWYIKREFKLKGLNLTLSSLFFNILPMLILMIVFIVTIIYPRYAIYLSIAGIIILSFHYIFSWRALSIEVRKKILSLMILKKFLK